MVMLQDESGLPKATKREVQLVLPDQASPEEIEQIERKGYFYDPATREVYRDVAPEPTPPPEPVEALQDDAPGLPQQTSPMPQMDGTAGLPDTTSAIGDPEEPSPWEGPLAEPSDQPEYSYEGVPYRVAYEPERYDQAIEAGATPEEIESRQAEGLVYSPLFGGFVPESHQHLGIEHKAGLDAGATPDELLERDAQGLLYSPSFNGFVDRRFAQMPKEHIEEVKRWIVDRPSAQTMKKLVFASEAGVDIDDIDDAYFNKWRNEWEGIELTDKTLRQALENAKQTASVLKERRTTLAKEETETADWERPWKAAVGETTMGGVPEDIVDLPLGQEMQRLAKAELAQHYLMSMYRQALDQGVMIGGELSFEGVKERDGWASAGDAARQIALMELSPESSELQEGSARYKSAGQIWQESGSLPVNVARGMMEFGGFFALAAKETIWDLGKSAVGATLGGIQDVGRVLAEESPEQFDVVGPGFDPLAEKNTREEAEQSRFVEEASKGVDELAEVLFGAGNIVSGVTVAAQDATATMMGMAMLDERDWRSFTDFVLTRPVDAAAMAAGGVGIARAGTARALVSARNTAARSKAAYENLYIAQQSGKGSRAAAKGRQASRFLPPKEGVHYAHEVGFAGSVPTPVTSASSARVATTRTRDVARQEGVTTSPTSGRRVLSKEELAASQSGRQPVSLQDPSTWSNIFSRGVSKESLFEALKVIELPKNRELQDALVTMLRDDLKAQALNTKHKVQRAAQVAMDPIGFAIAAGAKVLPAGAVRALKRRDTLLDEWQIVTDLGETSLLDFVSRRDPALAEKMSAIHATGKGMPEEILREIDDLLRQDPTLSGVDAWIVLDDGTELNMDAAGGSADLQDIFRRPLSKQETEDLLRDPQKVQKQVRKNTQDAKKSLTKLEKDKAALAQKLGLLPKESDEFFALTQHADHLATLENIPESFERMSSAERKNLARALKKRRDMVAERKKAENVLLGMLKPNNKRLSQVEKQMLRGILDDLGTVTHEWGARRKMSSKEAFSEIDIVRGKVFPVLDEWEAKSTPLVREKVRKILGLDDEIIGEGAKATEIFNSFYKKEILSNPDAFVPGAAARDLRLLAGQAKVAPSVQKSIDFAIDSFEDMSDSVHGQLDRIRSKQAEPGTGRTAKEKRAAARELKEITKAVNEELLFVHNQILDSLKALDDRRSALKDGKASRATREKALRDVERARGSDGNGSLSEMGRMIAAGVAPKAIPAKHIALAQAMKIIDNVDDDHIKMLAEKAFEQNGLTVAEARALGPEVQNYLKFVFDNYMAEANVKNAIAVYSATPLNMVDDAKIIQVRDDFKRATSRKLDIDAALDSDDVSEGYKKVLQRYKKLKEEGKEIPEKLQKQVHRMTMTAASELRTEMFNITAYAIEQKLLSPEVANLRIANYFPDLYKQHEGFFKGKLDEVELEGEMPLVRGVKQDSKTLYGDSFKKGRHKDKPLEERREKGLIDDPAATFMLGATRIWNDILTAKMYRELRGAKFSSGPFEGKPVAMSAEEFGSLSPGEQKLFKQVPGQQTELKIATKYGEMAGMYIPTELYDDIVNTMELPAKAFGLAIGGEYGVKFIEGYQKALSMWKLGNTAWNPVTQARNHVSNWFIADMNNMLYGAGSKSSRKLLIDGDLVDQAWTHQGDLVEEAIAAGLFGGDMVSAEINGALGMKNPLPSEVKEVIRRGIKNGSSGIEMSLLMSDAMAKIKGGGELASRSYQFGDEFYKLWRYGQIRALQKEFLTTNTLTREMVKAFGGKIEALDVLSHADPIMAKKAAVQRVFNDGFLDYSRTSKAVNWMRKGWSPFITFTAEMLPKFAERQAMNPIKGLFYREAFRVLNEYTSRIHGEPTLEDLEEIELARETLPTYSRMGGVYAGEKMIPTAEGELPAFAFMDVALWGPMGNLISPDDDTRGSGLEKYIPDLLEPQEPLTDTLFRIWFNRGDYSPTSGALFAEGSGVSGGEQAMSALNMARRKLLPPMLGGRNWDKIMAALTETPYGARGKMYDMETALWDVLGARTVDVPQDNPIYEQWDREIRKNELPQTSAEWALFKYDPDAWYEKNEERNMQTDAVFEAKLKRAGDSAKRLAIRAAKRQKVFNDVSNLLKSLTE